MPAKRKFGIVNWTRHKSPSGKRPPPNRIKDLPHHLVLEVIRKILQNDDDTSSGTVVMIAFVSRQWERYVNSDYMRKCGFVQFREIGTKPGPLALYYYARPFAFDIATWNWAYGYITPAVKSTCVSIHYRKCSCKLRRKCVCPDNEWCDCRMDKLCICEEYAKLAALTGNVGILEHLRDEDRRWDYDTCKAMAEFGHLDALKWACRQKCEWSACVCNAALRGGHVELLTWARNEHGCECANCRWDPG